MKILKTYLWRYFVAIKYGMFISYYNIQMATFFIKTDKQYYLAGQTVTGQVLLVVSSAISGIQGISLSFSAFQSLKWIHSKPIPQPASKPITTKPSNQLEHTIPLEQIHHTDKIEISECGTQQNSNSGLRPRFIRTAKNQFYEVEYNERRNDFAKSSIRILQSNKLQPGHYCFPFSLKPFQEWPGSIVFNSQQRKAQISYKLTASIDPTNPHFDFEACKEVIIINKAQQKKNQFENQITSCSCIGKGRTTYSVHTNQQLYSSESGKAKVIIQIDNTQCTTDINDISVSILQQIIFRQEDRQQKIQKVLLTNTLNGVKAQQKYIGEKAVIYNVDLSKINGLLPQSNGKFITSQNHISITLNYDAALYSAKTQYIPLKIRTQGNEIDISLVFTKDFKPKLMPQVALKLQSSFKNPYLSNGFTSTQKFNTP